MLLRKVSDYYEQMMRGGKKGVLFAKGPQSTISKNDCCKMQAKISSMLN